MKLCPYPFSRIQTGQLRRGFFPCCDSWFKDEYAQMCDDDPSEDFWNGKAAVELRRRMYEGDYSLCDRKTCNVPLFTVEELSDPKYTFQETPISPENLAAIKQKNPVMPELPSSLHLLADLTCNLNCQSCRPKIIPNSKPTEPALKEYDFVHKLKGSVEVIKMASGGEVFYSTLQRKLLKDLNPVDFPKLKRLHIISNGTVFNQKAYDDLQPGTSLIRDISISMDAGSKEVYEKIRGPYWEQLLENLRWMSEMRKANKFDFFSLHFVFQKGNFRDVPNFVKLGKELNVDRMLIQRYLPYPGQGFDTPEKQFEQSVHLPEHPDYAEAMNILEQFKNDSQVYSFLYLDGFEDKLLYDVILRKVGASTQDAKTLIHEGRDSEAFEILNYCLGLYPNNQYDRIVFPALYSIAYEVQQVDPKKAIGLFEYIDSKEPLTSDGHYSLGSCYRDIGNLDKALIHFKQSLGLNNDHASALNEITDILIHSDRIEIAFRELDHYLATHPHKIKNEYIFSGFYSFAYSKQTENPQLTIKIFNYIQSKIPLTADGEYCLANSYKSLGDKDKALEGYYKTLSMNPDHAYAAQDIGYMNNDYFYEFREKGFKSQSSGKYLEATEHFEKALSFKSGDPDLFYFYGISLKRTKRFEESLTYFHKVYEARPNHYHTLMEIGFLQYRDKNKSKALETFLKAKSIEPKDKKGFSKKYIKLTQRRIKQQA